MTSKSRSFSGAALMLVILPIFAGLLACMPEHVPLGNPDRAKIDPDLTGMWITEGDHDLLGQFTILQPWDKHTWMMTTFVIGEGYDADLVDYDLESYDGLVRLLNNAPEGEDGYVIAGALVYKVWLAKIAGEQFMMTELRGVLADDADSAESFWIDYRLRKNGPNEFAIDMLDADHPAFEGVPAKRRDWERVIRKNIDDSELFRDYGAVFKRVKPEHVELFDDVPLKHYGFE